MYPWKSGFFFVFIWWHVCFLYAVMGKLLIIFKWGGCLTVDFWGMYPVIAHSKIKRRFGEIYINIYIFFFTFLRFTKHCSLFFPVFDFFVAFSWVVEDLRTQTLRFSITIDFSIQRKRFWRSFHWLNGEMNYRVKFFFSQLQRCR